MVGLLSVMHMKTALEIFVTFVVTMALGFASLKAVAFVYQWFLVG